MISGTEDDRVDTVNREQVTILVGVVSWVDVEITSVPSAGGSLGEGLLLSSQAT